MSDDPMTPLRAAYVTQMQRAYAQSTRGIATPEQRRAWHDEANRLIAAHDRQVKAEALREAAVVMRAHKDPGHWNLRDEQDPANASQSPDAWLEVRAVRIAETKESGS